jgi:hypothetical protein
MACDSLSQLPRIGGNASRRLASIPRGVRRRPARAFLKASPISAAAQALRLSRILRRVSNASPGNTVDHAVKRDFVVFALFSEGASGV